MLCLYRSIARHGMPGWICRGHLSFPLIPSLYHATATVLEPVESPREGLLRPGPVGCSGCRYPGRQGRAGGPDDDWSSFTFPFSSFPHFPFLRLVVKCDLFFSPSPGLRLSLSLIYPSLSFPPTHISLILSNIRPQIPITRSKTLHLFQTPRKGGVFFRILKIFRNSRFHLVPYTPRGSARARKKRIPLALSSSSA